jgi:hypothetical protein
LAVGKLLGQLVSRSTGSNQFNHSQHPIFTCPDGKTVR